MKDIEKIYNAHFQTMYRIAMKMLSDKALALDVVQDVFVSILEIGKKGKTLSETKSYLIRSTLNRCIDYVSRGAKGKIAKINGQPYQVIESFEKKEENREVIRMALSAMNEDDRKLLVLYSEGYSYKEISDITGRKLNSVGKTLSRALKKMSDEIKKLDYELSQ